MASSPRSRPGHRGEPRSIRLAIDVARSTARRRTQLGIEVPGSRQFGVAAGAHEPVLLDHIDLHARRAPAKPECVGEARGRRDRGRREGRRDGRPALGIGEDGSPARAIEVLGPTRREAKDAVRIDDEGRSFREGVGVRAEPLGEVRLGTNARARLAARTSADRIRTDIAVESHGPDRTRSRLPRRQGLISKKLIEHATEPAAQTLSTPASVAHWTCRVWLPAGTPGYRRVFCQGCHTPPAV